MEAQEYDFCAKLQNFFILYDDVPQVGIPPPLFCIVIISVCLKIAFSVMLSVAKRGRNFSLSAT